MVQQLKRLLFYLNRVGSGIEGSVIGGGSSSGSRTGAAGFGFESGGNGIGSGFSSGEMSGTSRSKVLIILEILSILSNDDVLSSKRWST